MHTPLHQKRVQDITATHPIAAMLVRVLAGHGCFDAMGDHEGDEDIWMNSPIRVLAGHGCFDAMGDHDEDIWMNSPIDGTAFWVISPDARMAKNTLEGNRTRGWQLFLSQAAVSTWKEEPRISVPNNSAETEARVSEWVRARLAEQAIMDAQ